MSDIDFKKSNLIKVLIDGFDSQAIRDKFSELERQRGLLEQYLNSMEITKDNMINK